MQRSHPLFLVCFLMMFFAFSPLAYAQCTSVIPGLPSTTGGPCSNPFTPNDPLTAGDGPNASGSPNEEKHESDSCDADFMNQIYARSFLEANRDIMISSLLITKPDSVLEYSCFDQQVKNTADIAGPLFSESNLWLGSAGGAYSDVPNPGDPNIQLNVFMGDTRLDQSLDQLVMKSLDAYADKNFAHNFLGGTAGIGGDTIVDSVAAAGSACTAMNDVYELAKCENINDATFFMTFTEMAANDPRDTLPSGMQCNGTNPIVTAAIAVANNDGGTYAFKDNIISYIDLLNSTACQDPIPTGIIVQQSRYNYSPTGVVTPGATREFREYVCSNPGCYYEPGSLTSAGTCKLTP